MPACSLAQGWTRKDLLVLTFILVGRALRPVRPSGPVAQGENSEPRAFLQIVRLRTLHIERLGKRSRGRFHFYIHPPRWDTFPHCFILTRTLLICDVLMSNFSRYPKLGTQYPESNSAGNDVFAKFSAFIKNTKKDVHEGECVPASWFPLFSTWSSGWPLGWLPGRSWECGLILQRGGGPASSNKGNVSPTLCTRFQTEYFF